MATYFYLRMTDHNDMQETFSMADHDDHKIQIINVPSHGKMKKAGDKSTFDPSVIPDDIASNTLNIDHGYFLSFLPQQKSKNTTLLHRQSSKCENIHRRLGILKTSRELSIKLGRIHSNFDISNFIFQIRMSNLIEFDLFNQIRLNSNSNLIEFNQI